MFNPYVKAVIAMLVALAGALAAGYDDSVLTTSEIVVAIGAGFVAFCGTWAFSNAIAKAGVAAATAFISQLAIALQDDSLSAQEITTLAVVTLGALAAVYRIPNTAPAKYTEKAVSAPSPGQPN